jgi:hypothetical protein
MAYDSKWWGMRSGDLVGSNTITQDISDSIKKFFSKKDGKAGDIYLVIMALVAFGFGIAGYTSILSKFMGDLPSAVRIIIDLIPMGVGGYLFYLAFFNKFDSKVYMEASAALCIILMGMSLSSLAAELPSILGGTKFMVYWMFLSIPVIYLATSTVGALIYLGILLTWLGATQIIGVLSNPFMLLNGPEALVGGFFAKTGHAIFAWFFLLLILPHFMRYTDRPSYDTRKMVLGWVGGYLLIQVAMNSFTTFSILALPFLFVCFYMAGKEYYADGKFWWNRPFQTLTILTFVGLTWAMTQEETNGMMLMLSGLMEGSSINGWFAYIINLLVVLGVIAWAVYSVYNDYNSEKKANIMLMAFPAVFTLSLLIAKFAESGTIGAWLFNLYGIALGADYIMKGIKSKDYQILALGIIIALPILYYKIEDLLKEVLAGDNGQVVGGLILCAVSAGLLYIGINFYNSTRTNEE